MVKVFPGVFVFALVFGSCGREQGNLVESGDQADSISATEHSSGPIESPRDNRQPDDHSIYVGSIFFLHEDEVYTPLYYRSEIEESQYLNHEAVPVDSLIFKNDDVTRSRLPFSLAQEYFDFSGLQQVDVYDNDGFVSEAKFARVELLEDLIESQFIAVFKLLKAPRRMSYPAHCISSAAKNHYEISPVAVRTIEGETPTQSILEKLAIDTDVYNDSHIQVVSDKRIYSGISFLGAGVLLIETTNGTPRILMEVKEDESILDIMPTAIKVNGEPVLVLHMGTNETDMLWSAAAVFNGQGYELVEGNRVGP